MRRLAICVLLAAGCDSTYSGFLAAVPQEGAPDDGVPTHVIVGVDGMSEEAFALARAHGAFAGYHTAPLVSVFPATSEYAWSRVLHTPPMPGFNQAYYDAHDNEVKNGGVLGVSEHALRQGNGWLLPCWAAFDYLGEDELWFFRTYDDPEAALRPTLEHLFAAVQARRRAGERRVVAYLANVDVIGHLYTRARAAAALEEISREVSAFEGRHPGAYRFSFVADHGSTHEPAEVVDIADALRAEGVDVVESLADPPRLEGIPLTHVRVSYVGVATRMPEAVAERVSRHAWVDLAAVALAPSAGSVPRFALFHEGARLGFAFEPVAGAVTLDDPQAWRDRLGIDLPAGPVSDAAALAATMGGERPDLFRRVATAFLSPAVDRPDDVMIAFKDAFASFGFHVPGNDRLATAGFHGNLLRRGSMSTMATELGPLPPLVRGDQALAVLDALATR